MDDLVVVAYLSIESDADRFWAGALVVDWSGDPIEFAYTDKVPAGWATRLFVRDELPGFLLRRVFTESLLKVLARTPELLCFDEPTTLRKPASESLPLLVLAPPEVRLDSKHWKMSAIEVHDDPESRAWWTDRARAESVEDAFRRQQFGSALASHPFERLHAALRETPANGTGVGPQ